MKEMELAMVNAASKALKIHAKAPHLEITEVIKKVIPFMDADQLGEKEKIAAIAAVNGVIKLRREHREFNDRQIIEKFLHESKDLMSELKNEEKD